MTIYAASMILFLVMDSLGNIPVFLSVLRHVEEKRRPKVIIRETIIACATLLIFLFFGKSMMDGLQITQDAFGVAGGTILFLIALKMIFPKEETASDRNLGEPFIVPLAIPLLAGPSALATVILLASQQPDHMFEWLFAVIIASTASLITLLFASPLARILGTKGLLAIERLMGMILTTIAVQMLLTGLKHFFG